MVTSKNPTMGARCLKLLDMKMIRMVPSVPALFGIDGPTMHFMPKAVYASV